MFVLRFRFPLPVLLLAFAFAGRAQSFEAGQVWPDYRFSEVLHYDRPQLALSDFRGKYLLVHVWSHSCPPCIAAFPRLDSLQQVFGGRFQVVLVNGESADSTHRFFARKKHLYRPTHLPMATGQQALLAQLNMLGDLWLDTARAFLYQGDNEHTSFANVRRLLAGERLTFKQVRAVPDYDASLPLMAEGGGRWLDSITSYSYFFHHDFAIREIQAVIPGRNGITHRLCLPNISVAGLYTMAFEENGRYAFDALTTDIRVSDSSLFFPPTGPNADENWLINHTYTYDLKVPVTRSARLYEAMQQDLARQFGVKGTVEWLERPGWALVSVDSTLYLPRADTGASRKKHRYTLDSVLYYRHLPMQRMFATFAIFLRNFSSLPLINHVPYEGPIDFSLHEGILHSGDIEQLQQAFRRYGFALRRQPVIVPVLVLRDD